MTPVARYWGFALAALIPTGLAILIVGSPRDLVIAYSLASLVVIVGGWALLVAAAVREQPTVPPEPAAVRPPTEELELEEATR